MHYITRTIRTLALLAALAAGSLTESRGQSYTYPRAHFTESKLAVKTNLLGDMFWLPNIGIELPVSDHWSLQAAYFGVWYANDPKHNYW